MKILAACERSGAVRRAFAALGHDAWSCDLEAADDDSPQHIRGDVIDLLGKAWDLVIAFPPCTHLASSGAHRFAEKRRDGRQAAAVCFFLRFTRLSCRWAIENPVGIMSTLYRKPDQIIQPYHFGHDASKRTCLWLNGLEPLCPQTPDKWIAGRRVNGRLIWGNQTPSGQNRLGPSPDRARIRSQTYEGIAAAMAEQWGGGPA